MSNIEVNFNNLTETEREQLLSLVKKSNKSLQLSDIKVGETFKIGDTSFIKFSDENGVTVAVTKDIVFNSKFGDYNNLLESEVYRKLCSDFLPKIEKIVGEENVLSFVTDLTTLDGLKPYVNMYSTISLPTLDFYRANVDIFDKYKLDKWWWLATPESAEPHESPNWTLCVSPRGYFNGNYYNGGLGVRPLLHFVSSISVSCDN